jgi:protein ImuB
MLWLALHLPLLSLEAFKATALGAAPGATQPPIALLAEHRIVLPDAAAAARGVRAGMKRATALALAADLLLAQADSQRDAAALQAVAHAALGFTPAVTLHETHTVLLEVSASLRLFGGLAALHRKLLETLAPLGHHVLSAAAPTALGAALLAKWLALPAAERPGADFDPLSGPHTTRLAALARLLDAAAVWLLGPGREHWEALQGMGLRTLSDLRELPRAGLARRFGEGLLEDLDRALGRAPHPQQWLELPAVFETRLELYERADSAEQVLAAAAIVLARLVAWAQARHSRIAAFTLAMQHEPRHRRGPVPATELRIELAEPALDRAHLQLLLRERLAQVKLAAPTLELRLRCRDLVAAPAPNGELFPNRSSQALGWTRLLERLRSRLGDERVLRLQAVEDHRPERASVGVPALRAEGGRMSMAGAAAHTDRALPLHRPVWLLPDPLPLAERDALPLLHGQPLQLVSGPERIEAGWWDSEPAARDYFIAMAEDGSLLWVWRPRLPAKPDEAPMPWMLQGRFA